MDFLNSFKVPVPISDALTCRDAALLPSDDEISTSDSEMSLDEGNGIVSKSCGHHTSDALMRKGAICTPLSEIDWKCHHQCQRKDCAYRYGFLPFVADLRRRFWGISGSPVPSSKERRKNIHRELEQIHKGGGKFLFGCSASIFGGQTRFTNRHSSRLWELGRPPNGIKR